MKFIIRDVKGKILSSAASQAEALAFVKSHKLTRGSYTIHQEVESQPLPTAEENLADTDTYGEDYVPAPKVVETPVEPPVENANSLPNVETNMQTGEVDFISDDVDAGVEQVSSEPEAASTEVAGQTQDVEFVDQSTGVVEDEILGDAGEAVTDTATPEPVIYDFNSSEIAAIEVPVKEADDSQILEMIEVQPGVFALKSSYLRKNSKIRSASVRRGQAAKDFLKSAKAERSGLKVNLQNKVISLSSSKKALIFQHSNILGLIAVEAPLVRGIVNSKYNLFSSKNGHLVNANNQELSTGTYQRVIASVTSNRGVRQSQYSRNLFSEVEKGYVAYLLRSNAAIKSKAIQSNKKLQYTIRTLRQELARTKAQFSKERTTLKQQVENTTTSLHNLKNSVAINQSQINSEKMKQENFIKQQKEKARVESLARMML